MRILIVGGFLGSGKTTLIKKLLHGIIDSGKTVAIIENEIGEVGIDDMLLRETNIRVTPLFGGCVCCQIQGDLIEATNRIKNDISPDWLIIELTGVAFISNIVDAFSKYGDKSTPVSTIAIADASRWNVMVKSMRPIIQGQLKGTHMVLVNKIELSQPSAGMIEEMRAMSGTDKIVQLSADIASGDELLELIARNLERGDRLR